jgi:hypothetical protein
MGFRLLTTLLLDSFECVSYIGLDLMLAWLFVHVRFTVGDLSKDTQFRAIAFVSVFPPHLEGASAWKTR